MTLWWLFTPPQASLVHQLDDGAMNPVRLENAGGLVACAILGCLVVAIANGANDIANSGVESNTTTRSTDADLSKSSTSTLHPLYQQLLQHY